MTLFGTIARHGPCSVAAVALLVTAATARSDELPRPDTAYTGTETMTAGEISMVTTVWADGDRKRVEGEFGGQMQIILVRPDEERIYVLDPSSNSGMAIAYSSAAAGLDRAMFDWDAVLEGSEVIDGQAAARYSVAGQDPMGGPLTSTLWFDAKGILIRARTESEFDGQKIEGAYDLSDLTIGDINPALFDLPEGFEIQLPGN